MDYMNAENLTKQYGSGEATVTAVDGISFGIARENSWLLWVNQVPANQPFSRCSAASTLPHQADSRGRG
jgi:hypothetical protein